jgi:hypothetical protein
MDPNTIGVWRLSGALPLRKKLRMRLGLVLYVIGLQRLGVWVGTDSEEAHRRGREGPS